MFLCGGYEDQSKTGVVIGIWQDAETVRPQPLVGGSSGDKGISQAVGKNCRGVSMTFCMPGSARATLEYYL